MNLGFLGNFYLKEKRRAGESKFGNLGPLCPEEIFLKQSFLGGEWGQGETDFARKFSCSKMAFETKDYGKV